MKVKEYEMSDGRKAVFEYDENGVGKITLECMDELMEMVADRPQGEWIDAEIPLECGGSMPIQVCNLCKTFYPLAYTGGGHRFCPRRKRGRVMTIREMMAMYHSLKFVEELIDYIEEYPDDDYMTMECLCRKLVKHGLIDKVDGYYKPKESE